MLRMDSHQRLIAGYSYQGWSRSQAVCAAATSARPLANILLLFIICSPHCSIDVDVIYSHEIGLHARLRHVVFHHALIERF